jgi:adenosine kinase
MLGEDCELLATVGADFNAYGTWLERNGISQRYVERLDETYSGQAYVTTDLSGNQITAFHPGAMEFSARLDVPADAGIGIGLITPDSPDGIKKHARQFAEAGIPFILDPGQAITRFSGDELLELIELAEWVAVNDYEGQLLQQYTGLGPAQLAERISAMIVTRDAKGSVVHTRDRSHEIPIARPERVVDPTGCGDAHRAGLLYGLMHDLDWPTIDRIASLAGAYKVAHAGTQNHRFTLEAFRTRFEENFGYRF